MFAGFIDELAEQLRVIREIERERRWFGEEFRLRREFNFRRWRRTDGRGRRGGRRGTMNLARRRLHARQQIFQPGNFISREGLARLDNLHEPFPRFGTHRFQRRAAGLGRLIAQVADNVEDGKLPRRVIRLRPGNLRRELPG